MAEPEDTPEKPEKPSIAGFQRLFLDDDPRRAEAFLEKYPDAHWVQNVVDCIAALSDKTWDEIHLDHDLAGEWFVDSERQDCGMEVIRWLTAEPRKHLMAAKFVVHSHNSNASMVMVTQLGLAGYYVIEQPFGTAREEIPGLDSPMFEPARPNAESKKKPKDDFLSDDPEPKPGLIKRILRWFVPPPTTNQPWNRPPGFENAPDIDKLPRTGRPGGLRESGDSEDENEPEGPFVFPIRDNDPDSFRGQLRRRSSLQDRQVDDDRSSSS